MSRKKVRDKLKSRGFRLVSQNRHKKFRDARGRTIIMSASPSDVNAELAQLRDIDRISSTPVQFTQPQARMSSALLAPTLKRKRGASSVGGNGNAKVVGYIKADAPRTTEEQRESDRLESEWGKLLQRMKASRLQFQRQVELAITYCHTIYIMGIVRDTAAEFTWEVRKKNAVNKSYYLRYRPERHALLKCFAKQVAGKLSLDPDGIIPWLLGLTQDIDVRYHNEKDDEQSKEWRERGMTWALGHCMQFVPIPNWLGEHSVVPADWDARARRLMRRFPIPAGLRRMY